MLTDSSLATIGSSIGDLEKTISVLETHVSEMSYPGTDEFNVRKFSRHEFQGNAYRVLHDLAGRVQQLSDDFYSAEQERESYAALTSKQQLARTDELEKVTADAKAEQAVWAECQKGAAAREKAWAALPPEVTAPGRYHDSVSRCGSCGGRVETINNIHRCWACFRRGQDGG